MADKVRAQALLTRIGSLGTGRLDFIAVESRPALTAAADCKESMEHLELFNQNAEVREEDNHPSSPDEALDGGAEAEAMRRRECVIPTWLST